MTNKKIFLSELPKEEVAKMLQYPSELWSEMYEVVAEDNGNYASELMEWILGKGHTEWTKFDSTSYDWWINIKPGRYEEVLHINDYDYFSEDDAKKVKELQGQVKKLCDKIGELSFDDDDYYDKLDEMETKADEIANDILGIVRNVAKQAEEVSDEQIVDTFIDCDYGDLYYFYEGDKGTVYRNYTKSYKTNYKEN